jgi:hypothetical protein
MKIVFFGDSYLTHPLAASWTSYFEEINPDFTCAFYSKGGSNLFWAINRWHEYLASNNFDCDIVVFSFTWPQRLYSSYPYRNEQFCAYSEFRQYTDFEPDPVIVNDLTNKEFIDSIGLYYRYIHDNQQNIFHHELEIKYILDLPKRHPAVKFIFLPNTEMSRSIAKKHFENGILFDFAFETVSNREPNAPGVMPCVDSRISHLNDNNHRIFAELFSSVVANYSELQNKILPINLNQFDFV